MHLRQVRRGRVRAACSPLAVKEELALGEFPNLMRTTIMLALGEGERGWRG